MVKVVKGIHSHGSGLIGKKCFKAGEVIYRFPGKIIQSTPTYQTIQTGMDKHTLDFGILANINHACDPNTAINTEQRSVVALRAIASGEELTFFYPSTEWDMARPFDCQCNAPQCLRFIAGARYLAPDILNRYFINQHIRSLKQEILSPYNKF